MKSHRALVRLVAVALLVAALAVASVAIGSAAADTTVLNENVSARIVQCGALFAQDLDTVLPSGWAGTLIFQDLGTVLPSSWGDVQYAQDLGTVLPSGWAGRQIPRCDPAVASDADAGASTSTARLGSLRGGAR